MPHPYRVIGVVTFINSLFCNVTVIYVYHNDRDAYDMRLKRLLSKEGRDQLAVIISSFQGMYEEDVAVTYIYDGAIGFNECTFKAVVRVDGG